MPQHSTKPTGPQTWDHPSNAVDPRQLALPFEGTISSNRWPESSNNDPQTIPETAPKSCVQQVQRPKTLRTAARHRWEGQRCRQCGLFREGTPGRFTGHRFITPDGEIMKLAGDCPGNPPEQQNRKPRVDLAPETPDEAARRRAAKSEMRRQINAHKRQKSGEP